MTLDGGIRRHPTRYQLVAFAENMLDRRAPVSAAMASHIASCPACAAEIQAIRTCLEFTASAPGLEPSSDLTGQILLSAQHERRIHQTQQHKGWTPVTRALQGIVYTAALAAIAVVVFGAALGRNANGNAAMAPLPQMAENAPSPESIKKKAEEVETLSAAVRSVMDKSLSPLERRKMLAVNAMDADIAAAMSALERNPGCARATHIVNANLQRQAETLRNLYVERKL